jgi:phosphoenolpyruvate carboxykinase (GTP)
MAMLPFCGYNMADYFAHWLDVGNRVAKAPKIFRVNWFRKGEDGKFLWPGYGDNMRVLKWMVERIHGERPNALETPIGWLPRPGDIDTSGTSITPEGLKEALRVDAQEWLTALDDLEGFYNGFGSRLPASIAKTLAETQRKFRG